MCIRTQLHEACLLISVLPDFFLALTWPRLTPLLLANCLNMVEVEVLPEAGQAANGQDQQAAQSDTKQDATSFIEQGQKYYAKENYAEAAEAYSHAVELLCVCPGTKDNTI